MDRPRWADDPSFANLADRVRHADALDGHIAAWTSTRDRYHVMELLQAVRVPAGVVQDAADRLERDPQLKARGHFTPLGNGEVEEMPLEGLPAHLSVTGATPGGLRRGPPTLGEDNEYVLGEILGKTGYEIRSLEKDGVLT